MTEKETVLLSIVTSFIKANDESFVMRGYAKGKGGEGAVCTLYNGKRFNLSSKACEQLAELGYPKWGF